MFKKITFLFVLFPLFVSAEAPEKKALGFGAGTGLYYAHSMLGVNLNYSVNNLDFLAALGMHNHWGGAVRYYVFDKNRFFQTRIGLFYGTNGDLRLLDDDDKLSAAGFPDTYKGWTLTVGTRLAFGKKRNKGIGIDIGYRVTDGGLGDDEDYYDKNLEGRTHGSEGLAWEGAFVGLVGGSYDLQLSVGWEMEF